MREFFTGAVLLLRGIGMYARSPQLLVLGVIPALISGALFITAFGALVYFSSDLGEVITWFADDWAGGVREVVRFVAAVGVIGLGGLLGVLVFTAVTLLIGDPFYEKISERVEDQFGGVPNAVDERWH